MSQGNIAIISLGGTIAMTAGPQGLIPTRNASDLVRGLEAAAEGLRLETVDLMRKPSASLTFDDVQHLAQTIDAVVAAGATGVVVAQGTDTLEETAFAIELLSAAPAPIVFTGAMRGASAPGYDGAVNLADAISVARHAEGRGEVFVVMHGQAHAARFVVKNHSSTIDAFASPNAGPLMHIHEGRVYEHTRMNTPRLPRIAAPMSQPWPRVALAPLALGDDGALLMQLPRIGYQGCVLATMGAGHAPAASVEAITALAQVMPVVMCTRAPAGRVFEATYDYPGAETDLIRRGALPGGPMAANKARLLLLFCLAAHHEGAIDAFAQRRDVF